MFSDPAYMFGKYSEADDSVCYAKWLGDFA
jgi:hypothetical protein